MPNQLKNENSPYLKQHENNPVNWLPWSKKSLEKAKNLTKPIFLSVGYASCHWCHVMAHESFENLDTAKIMNQRAANESGHQSLVIQDNSTWNVSGGDSDEVITKLTPLLKQQQKDTLAKAGMQLKQRKGPVYDGYRMAR